MAQRHLAQPATLAAHRRLLRLDEPIKSLGEHVVSVRLHPEVHAEVRVSVVPE